MRRLRTIWISARNGNPIVTKVIGRFRQICPSQKGRPRRSLSPGAVIQPRRLQSVVVGSIPARRPVSRILSCAVIPLGAASPRTLISDLPGGSGKSSSRLNASGRCAARAWLLARALPPYLVLLRVGFTLPPSLQPERCALTAPFHPYPGAEFRPDGRTPPAVSGAPS